jgi:tetratricopeptide (TPR) repeat protein
MAGYCAALTAEQALSCAADAQRVGLIKPAVVLLKRAGREIEDGVVLAKAPMLIRLIDLLDAAGDTAEAARAAQLALKLFPNEQVFREREKNLLARDYMHATDLAEQSSFRDNLQHHERQEAMYRPADHLARSNELEARYWQSKSLEDFQELMRALRESTAARRESALSTLQDGLNRFGQRETLWFIREIRLERKWAEVRVHRQVLGERPDDAAIVAEHEQLRQGVLREQIEHLYEVVSALPPNTPERHRRELELARHLFDAGRHEEAIKQSQLARRAGGGSTDGRNEALVVMAKSFVQLGLTPEASECFQQLITELSAGAASALEAKYSYAEFLLREAEHKRNPTLAAQARKLCSDVMIQDIDYRSIRELSAAADRLVESAAKLTAPSAHPPPSLDPAPRGSSNRRP